MNTADTMRDFCQYYRCFLQILMIERTHWLGLLRLLWQILWDNSSLSTLLFIQNCKRYLSNETCVYWCSDFKYQIKHKITGLFDWIITVNSKQFYQNIIVTQCQISVTNDGQLCQTCQIKQFKASIKNNINSAK